MICAYAELYRDDAQETLGTAFDFATFCAGLALPHFYQMFLGSPLSAQFARGNPFVVSGQSGIELASRILEENGFAQDRSTNRLPTVSRSPEYWTGWALASYQWYSALSFQQIESYVPIGQITAMYPAYHEMDISHFHQDMDALIAKNCVTTRLHTLRTAAGYSQSELAAASGVSVRTIQHYEQRQKDINKAQIDQLLRLARALNCDVLDLLEPLEKSRYEYALVQL